MNKITGNFNIELWVDCPQCKESFDVMETDEWQGGGYECIEEFGSKEGVDLDLICPNCKKEFIMNDVCY